MIRRIELHGFMSHTDSVFELAPCLTVLTGPNNCGKSAVVEALQCVCGYGRGGFMVRHGEKTASVVVETSEGYRIEWRRVKDTPSFVLNGTEIFRNQQPEDLQALLRLPRVPAKEGNDEFDVHFGEQKKPIFLLGESGGRAATFFASSSDAQYLVRMHDLHRERTRTAKGTAKRLVDEVSLLAKELSHFASLDEISGRLLTTEAAYEEITGRLTAAMLLDLARQDLAHQMNLRESATQKASIYSALLPPPFLKPAQALETHRAKIDTAAAAAQSLKRTSAALADLAPQPPLRDTAGLARALDRVTKASAHARFASQVETALKAVETPPLYRGSEALAAQIGALDRAKQVQVGKVRTTKALTLLPVPPEILDTPALGRAVAGMEHGSRGITTAKDALAEATTALAGVTREIRAWARRNEVCPTCGSQVNADRLLRQLELTFA